MFVNTVPDGSPSIVNLDGTDASTEDSEFANNTPSSIGSVKLGGTGFLGALTISCSLIVLVKLGTFGKQLGIRGSATLDMLIALSGGVCAMNAMFLKDSLVPKSPSPATG